MGSYRTTRSNGAAGYAAKSQEMLADQLATAAWQAAQRKEAAARYEARLAAGQRTPAAEIFDAEDMADLQAFFEDMAASRNPGSFAFTPMKMLDKLAAGVESAVRVVVSSRADRPMVIPVTADGANGGKPVQADWRASRGWPIGTTKQPPSNWTSAETRPDLVVLFTDQTVGIVPSEFSERGRIRPQLHTQPRPLGVDETIVLGVYSPVMPNILKGVVGIPEDVQALLPENSAGALFNYTADLGHTLEVVADGHISLHSISFDERPTGLSIAALNAVQPTAEAPVPTVLNGALVPAQAQPTPQS